MRDGAVQHRIDVDEVTYHRNSLTKNTPRETAVHDRDYDRHATPVEGQVTRELPSERFDDHFSQARLFFNSMSQVEKDDMATSFCHHLGKVKSRSVRQQTVEMFANVDTGLAGELADCIEVERSSINHVEMSETSPSLSVITTTYSPQTIRVEALVGEDFDEDQVGVVFATQSSNFPEEFVSAVGRQRFSERH